jgi:hypothetical protein
MISAISAFQNPTKKSQRLTCFLYPPWENEYFLQKTQIYFLYVFLDLEILEVVQIFIFVGLGFALHVPGVLA